jgi:hypothetical protein
MGLLHLMTENKTSDGNMLKEVEDIRRNARASVILESGRSYETGAWNGISYADRWPRLQEDFESEDDNVQWRAALTMHAIEETRKLLDNHKQLYGEAVVQASLGALNPRVLDVVRIFYPNQIAQDLVDIQPLNGQIGQIFTMKPRFGGPVAGVPGVNVGNQMFLPSTYPTDNNYASETSYQQVGTGTGAVTTFTYALVPTPIRPSTVQITSGSVTATDDGNGNLTGTGVSSGTVNYATGAVSITFATAPANLVAVQAQWNYSSEVGEFNIRTVEFDLTLTPVTAKIHPLQFKYSVAAGLAASAHLAIDVQDVLTNTAATYLKIERDNNIVSLINSNANADSTLNFNCDMTGKNYDKRSFYGEIEIKLDEAMNNIQNAVGRGGLDWILCGRNAYNVFAQSRTFKSEPVKAPIGSYRAGTLRDGTITVIKSLTMDPNAYTAGFKGYMAGDAATVLAEWIPLYSTPLFQNPTLNNQGGMCSIYDLFVNNASYYRTGEISNYSA